MAYTVRKKLQAKPAGKILRDDLILLKGAKSRGQYPEIFRRVEMLVEVDGKEVVMAFITNNTQWAVSSVGELYQESGLRERGGKRIYQSGDGRREKIVEKFRSRRR